MREPFVPEASLQRLRGAGIQLFRKDDPDTVDEAVFERHKYFPLRYRHLAVEREFKAYFFQNHILHCVAVLGYVGIVYLNFFAFPPESFLHPVILAAHIHAACIVAGCIAFIAVVVPASPLYLQDVHMRMTAHEWNVLFLGMLTFCYIAATARTFYYVLLDVVAVGFAPRLEHSLVIMLSSWVLIGFNLFVIAVDKGRYFTGYTVAQLVMVYGVILSQLLLLVVRENSYRQLVRVMLMSEARCQQVVKRVQEVNDVLQWLLPSGVLPRIVKGERILDRTIATVLVSDIANFTAWCSSRTASQVVEMLSEVINTFDHLALVEKVVRIKTVGDGYVAVCGLPTPLENHAGHMIRFAFSLQEHLTRLCEVREKRQWGSLQVRVGVHTGAVVGAMLSNHRWAYDLYGPTREIAEGLEQLCPRGDVLVSEDCHAHILSAVGEVESRSFDDAFLAGRKIRTFLLQKSTSAASRSWSSDSSNAALVPVDFDAVRDFFSQDARFEEPVEQSEVATFSSVRLSVASSSVRTTFSRRQSETDESVVLAAVRPIVLDHHNKAFSAVVTTEPITSLHEFSISVAPLRNRLPPIILAAYSFLALLTYLLSYPTPAVANPWLIFAVCCAIVALPLTLAPFPAVAHSYVSVVTLFLSILGFVIAFGLKPFTVQESVGLPLVVLGTAFMYSAIPTVFFWVLYVVLIAGLTVYFALNQSHANRIAVWSAIPAMVVLILFRLEIEYRNRKWFSVSSDLKDATDKAQSEIKLLLSVLGLKMPNFVAARLIERRAREGNTAVDLSYEFDSILVAFLRFTYEHQDVTWGSELNDSEKKRSVTDIMMVYRVVTDAIDDVLPPLREVICDHPLSLLTKVKTIGDIVIIAGCMDPSYRSFVQSADLGRQMIVFLRHLRSALKQRSEVLGEGTLATQVGMDIGPVTTAVMGRQQLEYDIFGTTVNTASRMMGGLFRERSLSRSETPSAASPVTPSRSSSPQLSSTTSQRPSILSDALPRGASPSTRAIVIEASADVHDDASPSPDYGCNEGITRQSLGRVLQLEASYRCTAAVANVLRPVPGVELGDFVQVNAKGLGMIDACDFYIV